MTDRPIVRVLWHSTDRRHWAPVNVLARSPLAAGIHHPDNDYWTDGFGNYYRNTPPKDTTHE